MSIIEEMGSNVDGVLIELTYCQMVLWMFFDCLQLGCHRWLFLVAWLAIFAVGAVVLVSNIIAM